jgi:GGDEF domain-containing protein
MAQLTRNTVTAQLVARGELLAMAGRALERRLRSGAAVVVVAAGLDDVTGNGNHHHHHLLLPGGPAQDEVVRAAAADILAVPGPGEAGALLGNGELAILCTAVQGSGDADPLVQRIYQVTAHPVRADGLPFSVTAATGLAMASSARDTADTLIAAARQAMRAARQSR